MRDIELCRITIHNSDNTQYHSTQYTLSQGGASSNEIEIYNTTLQVLDKAFESCMVLNVWCVVLRGAVWCCVVLYDWRGEKSVNVGAPPPTPIVRGSHALSGMLVQSKFAF